MDTLSNWVWRGLTVALTVLFIASLSLLSLQTSAHAADYFAITSPTNGAFLTGNTNHTITWSGLQLNFLYVEVYYSLDGGSNWTQIGTRLSVLETSCVWLVPTANSSTVVIRVDAPYFTYDYSLPYPYVRYHNNSDYRYIGIDSTWPSTPGTPYLSLGSNPNNTGTFSIAWDASTDSPSNIQKYRISRYTNGGSNVSFDTTNTAYSFANLPEGEYAFYIEAFDNAGHGSAWSNGLTVKVDKTPPTFSITELPPYQISESFPVIWSGSDPDIVAGLILGSGIGSITIEAKEVSETYSLVHDWAAWTASTGPGSKTFTAGEDGHKYYFRSVARDNAGNTSVFSPIKLTIVDLNNPQPPVILMNNFYTPTSPDIIYSWNRGGNPSIKGAAADSGSGVSKVYLRVQRTSDGSWWDGSSPWGPNAVTFEATGTSNWSTNIIPSDALSTNEVYKVYAYSKDAAGRTSAVSNKQFTFLEYPPDLEIDSPLLDSIFDTGTITFTGKADGKIPGSAYSISYAQIYPVSGPETVFWTHTADVSAVGSLADLLPEPLSDGRYSIVLKMEIPGVGTFEVTTTIRIDHAMPITTANITGPEGGRGWYMGPVNVALSVLDEGSVDNLNNFTGKTYYKIDGNAWETYTYGSPLQITTDGVHTLKYYSVDEVNHMEPTKECEIKIDLYDPVLSITAPTSSSTYLTNEVTVLLGGTCASDTDSISVNGSPADYTAGETSWQKEVTLTDGENVLIVTDIDLSGRQSQDSVTITLDRTPPVIEEIKLNGTVLFGAVSPSINANPAVNPKVILPTPTTGVRATDNLTDFATYDGVKVELINGSGSTVWEMTGRSTFPVAEPIAAGIYTLRVTATDMAGNSTIEAISDIIVTGGDPEILTKIIVSPNPFDPLSGVPAKIWFTPTGDPDSLIALYIHDITGRLVWKRTFTVGEQLITKRVDWNGYTDYGQVASNGGYLLRVVDEGQKKLIGKAKIAVIKGTI